MERPILVFTIRRLQIFSSVSIDTTFGKVAASVLGVECVCPIFLIISTFNIKFS